ncbi:MAG: hypothetical protein COA71_00375 [SAR86 cluster bacterium]|uniref:Uncharacterized protein n=1 Tax=SAR86 cluster bacterium TaxID=2030880 RepID=A0A2A5CHY0_9GAMM|nr:MAG: hypothetical protein COA71_00375 [SAR86 cluster bacterium]
MSKNWLSEENARIFFLSLSGLELLSELLSALENIMAHFPGFREEIKNNQDLWNKINRITQKELKDIGSVKNWIDDALYDVQVSINSNDTSELVRIDPKAMFSLLLPAVVNNSNFLANTRFKVFVDEFENLAEYQQKIINGYRKHSDAFLSWNVAHKRFAQLSNATDGDEKLQLGDDYRDYILDESFENETEERFFLCELLLLGLLSTGIKCSISNFDGETLGDREKLGVREKKEYRESVRNCVKRIFPNESNRELAKFAMGISSVKTVVTDSLNKISGLTETNKQTLINEQPAVAVATVAIASQISFKSEDLISFIDSDFSSDHKYSQRVQTYLFTALLNLNARYSYITIPMYSGFDRFCQLSTHNIRHFFELCYQSFCFMDIDDEIETIESFPCISFEDMHKGAINASNNIIKEIPTYTPMGLTLSGLVNRLGTIFQIWQKGESQSEPEKTHFYIRHDFGALPKNIADVIEQAKCWRVFIEYSATKDKNSDSSSGFEYRLNPIYAPHFNISFRKIRRLEFSEEEFSKITFGDSDEYEVIRARHIKNSKLTNSQNTDQGTFFDD